MKAFLVALCLALVPAAALAPTAEAGIGNCPNGWNGVIVPHPDGGDPVWGLCCTPWWPMTCQLYRLGPLEDLQDLLP